VFFCNSGAEANEAAIKLVRKFRPRGDVIVALNAFHGRTYGALSLTSSKAKQHAGFGPFLPDVHHVPYGYCYRCEYGKTFPSCGLFCVSAIERDLFARHLDPRDVAAIFVEPIQGEGGYVVPPPGWLAAVRELCDQHGILLVADEVQCGIGRTGQMFACELAGVEPDILLAAKGLGSGMPIGAIIAKDSVSKWESGSHGTTFGGNPVSCAAALATLDVVERDLLPHVKARGERLQAGLRALAAKHEVIGDLRGMGLMQGVELVASRATREPDGELVHRLEGMAFAKGLLTLAAGKNVLRLAPPLVVDDGDVDIALEVLGECLEELD
jgi:4-aminobutyrate aminotransferase